MPTSFPVYKFRSKTKDQLASNFQALLDFYGAIAVILLMLLMLEIYFGAFNGLSGPQAILKVTGIAHS